MRVMRVITAVCQCLVWVPLGEDLSLGSQEVGRTVPRSEAMWDLDLGMDLELHLDSTGPRAESQSVVLQTEFLFDSAAGLSLWLWKNPGLDQTWNQGPGLCHRPYVTSLIPGV
uniref:Uncharacterized protein n=1 Tax=Knipowitschia caucasica TaxID=637954 RepID=A0AAV2KZB1_KNICA